MKALLQSERDSGKLETLAASLFAKLLNVPVLVAKSGFQFGADAGTAGRQGRRLRIEAKKYSDTTALSDRELLGELVQAAAQDEALEAWVLVATRTVPEQLGAQLIALGEKLGVPVLIFDWPDQGPAELATLCAAYPELVEASFGAAPAALARQLGSKHPPDLSTVLREVASWRLGYAALRDRSHEALAAIWSSAQVSKAELGQDVAGGDRRKRVARTTAEAALDDWWEHAAADAPAAVTGWDGVGKTWALFGWTMGRLDALPIVLVASSAAAAGLKAVSEAGVKRFLAERLQDLSPSRSHEHWLGRLDRLLARPGEEGPNLTLVLDGLNQEPEIAWVRVLQVLQGPAFAGRVRIIATTRNLHFEERLKEMRSLAVAPTRITVEPYSLGEEGELAEMLAFEQLTLTSLHPDLLPLARVPRLFPLVVRFRERLVEAGRVTVHRLLWEYGRDSLGDRGERSFSEAEWREWLQTIARRVRAGLTSLSTRELADLAARPDLGVREVFARLSDIVDGRFAERTSSGAFVLSPSVVVHALAAALIEELAGVASDGRDAVDAALSAWLDPIAGLDQRAEILRAAVSILLETGEGRVPGVAGVLVAAWLQTQNIADEHRLELQVLAPELCGALLDALELSRGRGGRSATVWAVDALRAIPRAHVEPWSLIVARVADWFSFISRDLSGRARHPDFAKQRVQHLVDRIGHDTPGPLIVLGQALTLADDEPSDLRDLSPALLDGLPLALAIPVFRTAALSLAIGGNESSWAALKWLCLLNPHDPFETAEALRAEAAWAAGTAPEPGVATGLPGRVAALLLWLTGFEADDAAANEVDSGIDHWLTYENDYLTSPSRSFFRLERRHADLVFSDPSLSLRAKLDRTERFWSDPSFTAWPEVAAQLAIEAAELDVDQLSSRNARGELDYRVEKLELPLARMAPDALDALAHRQLASLARADCHARYWKAAHALQDFIVADQAAAAAARTLRLSGREPDPSYETAAASYLLMLEIQDVPAFEQFSSLIDADLNFMLLDFMELLRQPSTNDVERLIARYGSASDKAQRDLLMLLSTNPEHLGEIGWGWVEAWLDRATTEDARGQAFQTLDRSSAARLGRSLLARGWSWSAREHIWANHHGSNALIEATLTAPFDQVVSRLAPWRVLEAARRRGGEASEVRLAADVFGAVLTIDAPGAPDLGSDVTVDLPRSDGALSTLSIEMREPEHDGLEGLQRAFDVDGRRAEQKRASNVAFDRIREARRTGADLYLMNMDPADFAPVIRLAERQVLSWVEGEAERSRNFRTRVSRGEGAFLALCEAWLAIDPERGGRLWRALGEVMTTRYTGLAQVDERLHILFRAPSSPVVDALRVEQLDLERCATDRRLFDLALAASLAGQEAWLDDRIAEDLSSPLPWRQRRGITLSGFGLPSEGEPASPWVEGEASSSFDEARREAMRRQNRAIWARYWWREYVEAQTPQAALAAWTVFGRTADARAWKWMANAFDERSDRGGLQAKKAAHAQFNLSNLRRAFEKQAKDGEDKLFGRKIASGIGPWQTRL